MNPDPIPGFDAVAESRKWREATGHKLFAMSREERMAYLSEARTRYLAERKDRAGQEESCVVREEPPTK
jgi:hypothetical protein